HLQLEPVHLAVGPDHLLGELGVALGQRAHALGDLGLHLAAQGEELRAQLLQLGVIGAIGMLLQGHRFLLNRVEPGHAAKSSAAAMQSRCCCPPDNESALVCSRSFTSSHRAAWRRLVSATSGRLPRIPFSLSPATTLSRIDMVGNGLARWKTIPTRRRRSTGSTPRACRSLPSTRMWPLWWAPGTNSCMRLMQRTNVLLPQ